jgi:hypothetical protein
MSILVIANNLESQILFMGLVCTLYSFQDLKISSTFVILSKLHI